MLKIIDYGGSVVGTGGEAELLLKADRQDVHSPMRTRPDPSSARRA
jgi:hypothetical protein